ncbi:MULTISPECIES: hypothetical protein [unclassified Enterococcus]|uniref:hypothetical protein n=1 Tax=unclassified Enterococcus TaxID=2608891 RepID=UPI001CE08E87|nr:MULTISPECIES: hypothetical protein [unclassified Enterococcus]MCA5013716.1 hypothetical protein [Enterococcus sp. S23]MCA5016966.1 hypothetical protein [Enterococcus sp. S22(2020)]
MKKKWILATILGMIVLIILCIGGKKYMNKKAVEKSYQDGIELIQNYVTDYLVKNYEGIEKIEWQGVGVEWRSSPVFGGSILGNYVVSDVKVFVSSDKFFTMDFTLTEKLEYDQNLKKYVLTDYMNPSNLESTVEMEIGNATRELSEKNKLRFKKVKKSDKGSPNAQIILNLDIHELTY